MPFCVHLENRIRANEFECLGRRDKQPIVGRSVCLATGGNEHEVEIAIKVEVDTAKDEALLGQHRCHIMNCERLGGFRIVAGINTNTLDDSTTCGFPSNLEHERIFGQVGSDLDSTGLAVIDTTGATRLPKRNLDGQDQQYDKSCLRRYPVDANR